jgi:FMN-dependent NADH-azoreductase
MARLLHIEASPRGEASRSTLGARTFLAALRAADPALLVDHLDLWGVDLPPFDGAALSAKYARLTGRAHDLREQTAWAAIEAMVARLDRADSVLVSTPMWNFSIPYRLKHWIDLITQPGLTFSFDPAAGYAPLLQHRPTLVVLASAGDYATGESRGRPDLATPYLRAAFGFIGLTDPTIVPVGPTVGAGAETAADAASLRLRDLAKDFLRGVS